MRFGEEKVAKEVFCSAKKKQWIFGMLIMVI